MSLSSNGKSNLKGEKKMSVNCWKYAREVYLVGRSLKFRSFTDKERKAVIDFIVAMAGTRPAYVPYINLKFGNTVSGEIAERLAKQNDLSLAKMVQKIGRSLKIQFCTEDEKALCDALFAATDNRRGQGYNDYVTDEEVEESSTTEENSSENEEATESSETTNETGEETSSENEEVTEGTTESSENEEA
jgi:hypothetical protein